MESGRTCTLSIINITPGRQREEERGDRGKMGETQGSEQRVRERQVERRMRD